MTPCILIVEDEDAISDIIANVLTSRGYATLVATNGLEAIDYLEQGRSIDLVLLDWMLPRLTGEEFAEIRREHPAWSSIPVVVVSALDVRPERYGLDGYLGKPFTLHDLLDTVARFVPSPDDLVAT